VVIALVALGVLLWRVSDVLVPIFAGMVLAVILHSCARLIRRLLPLPPIIALLAAVLALLVLLGLVGLLVGARTSTQFNQLAHTLPAAWARVLARLQQLPLGRTLLGMLRSQASSASAAAWIVRLQAMATVTLSAVVNAILVLFTGLFLAANPRLYRRGLLAVIPHGERRRAAGALDAAVVAVGQWLKGVLVSMISIGVMSGLGLWGLGIPLALTLGILSGLMEFIPYVGPVLGAIPAVLLAFSLSVSQAVEVVALYLGLHLIEANLLVPLIQRWAVALPPALGIISVVIFGQLFGLIGIMFATPMTVVALSLVDSLLVRRAAQAGPS
jgi:predicted PurR-regulated permease PerM